MSEFTRVYLITGFLGSGKTTLLNRIIKRFPKDKKLTILMNEFGEIGIDGTLIEGEDIDMLEISRGSIFCVCVKTDFIKGLYELKDKVKPDVLLIESTGVANPSDLKRDLKLPIFNDRFQFMEQFCLVDAAHFLDAYEAYASIEKQIASSSVFVINKTDLASSEKVKEVKALIRRFHPEPIFYETTFADIPFERFFFEDAPLSAPERAEMGTRPVMSSEELEKYIDELLDSPDLEITPPDRLVSVTYQWRGNDLEEVKSMAQRLPKAVLRAKGFVEEKGVTYLFSYVMGDWTVEPSQIPKDRIHHKNVLVFIAPPESMEGIEQASKPGNWLNLGVFQPMSQSKTA
jgi:G3E family GTPase